MRKCLFYSMFSDLIQKLGTFFLKHDNHSGKLKKSLSESQPIAFFITASLVIATFLGTESNGQQYTLIASLAFFFAYLGLHAYNFTKDYPFFYWSASLVVVGIFLLYFSFIDVYSIIISSEDPYKKTLAFSIFCSILYVVTWSNLNKYENKNSKRYIFSKNSLWASFLFLLFTLPLAYIGDLNIFILFLRAIGTVLSFVLGIASFFSIILLDSNIKKSKKYERSRL